MNTSRKGAAYENATRRWLEGNGMTVARSAASKGTFDLIAWDTVVSWWIQCRSTATCAAMDRWMRDHRYDAPRVKAVHRSRDKEFCWHD